MYLDTHCHLDAGEFDADRDAVVARARAAGVVMMVVPAVAPANFERVRDCAHRYGLAYALGIHPLYVDGDRVERDLAQLDRAVTDARDDPRFIGIGEIGLDFLHVVSSPKRPTPPRLSTLPSLSTPPSLSTSTMRSTTPTSPSPPMPTISATPTASIPPFALQEAAYRRQLELARRHGLPVILHVRRSADRLLYHLRQVGGVCGIAHAFNGSDVQAKGFLDLGFRLGFGGAVTYDGSLRIRGYAQRLPPGALVLETDAPDIPPQWLRGTGGVVLRNEPAELVPIAAVVAALRGVDPEALAATTRANALAALPRLAALG